jgi:hypothetical protein
MPPKSRLQRMREVRRLSYQLEVVGIDADSGPAQDFSAVAKTYIDTGKGVAGAIPLPQCVLWYELTERVDVPCTVVLKATHK